MRAIFLFFIRADPQNTPLKKSKPALSCELNLVVWHRLKKKIQLNLNEVVVGWKVCGRCLTLFDHISGSHLYNVKRFKGGVKKQNKIGPGCTCLATKKKYKKKLRTMQMRTNSAMTKADEKKCLSALLMMCELLNFFGESYRNYLK